MVFAIAIMLAPGRAADAQSGNPDAPEIFMSGAAFFGIGEQIPGLHVQKNGTNYMKNPSAGVNTDGSYSQFDAVIERHDAGCYLGGSCWKVTTGGDRYSGIVFREADAFELPPLDPGHDQYALSFWAKALKSSESANEMRIYAFETSPFEIWASLGEQELGDDWRLYSLTFTVDDTDLQIAVLPHADGTGSEGTVVLIDGVTLEPERSFDDFYQGTIANKSYAVPPYNGDSPGCYWEGEPHASRSARMQGKADIDGSELNIDFDRAFWFGMDVTLGFNREDSFETISTEWLSVGTPRGDGLGWVDNVALVFDWHSPYGIGGDYRVYFHREEAGSGAEIVMPRGIVAGDVMRAVGIFDPDGRKTHLYLRFNDGEVLSDSRLLAYGPGGGILPMPPGHMVGIGYANGWEGPWQTNSAHRNLVLEQGLPTADQISAYLSNPDEPVLNGGYFLPLKEAPSCKPVRPGLSPSYQGAYWASFRDYTDRILSIDISITNEGPVAYSVEVVGATNTMGVTLDSDIPVVFGDIAAGDSATATVAYTVPAGIGAFRTSINATARDACGVSHIYPDDAPI